MLKNLQKQCKKSYKNMQKKGVEICRKTIGKLQKKGVEKDLEQDVEQGE